MYTFILWGMFVLSYKHIAFSMTLFNIENNLQQFSDSKQSVKPLHEVMHYYLLLVMYNNKNRIRLKRELKQTTINNKQYENNG
jgi:hypothetical protein